MDDWELLLEQAHSVVALLRSEEQPDGRRLIAVCEQLTARERHEGKLLTQLDDIELKRELGRLVELLSRRSSTAIVLGTLGRAALAELAGDTKNAEFTRREFSTKLGLLGL